MIMTLNERNARWNADAEKAPLKYVEEYLAGRLIQWPIDPHYHDGSNILFYSFVSLSILSQVKMPTNR